MRFCLRLIWGSFLVNDKLKVVISLCAFCAFLYAHFLSIDGCEKAPIFSILTLGGNDAIHYDVCSDYIGNLINRSLSIWGKMINIGIAIDFYV